MKKAGILKKSNAPVFQNKNLVKFAVRMDFMPFENENKWWM